MVGIELNPNTIYHSQRDVHTNIVNKWLEGYLHNYVSENEKAWVKWLNLGKHYYKNTYHINIGMEPFLSLCGYDAPSFVDLAFGDNRAPKAKD
jgi:hypothetical protein